MPMFVAYGLWPYGHIWPYLAIYGHMAIGPQAANMGMWGIPEKNYQKLAQQCKLDHSNVLPAHEMTRSPFAGFSPIVIPIENFKWDAQCRLWVYKFETLRNALYCQDKKSLQSPCPKSKILYFGTG